VIITPTDTDWNTDLHRQVLYLELEMLGSQFGDVVGD
jgi:hypothetical protein